MTAIVPISRGLQAQVDEDDLPLVEGLRWTAAPSSQGKFYAMRTENKRTVYMHRLILGAKRGEVVDHINGDTLDNRRSNLRIGTLADNAVNRRYESASGYRGVFKEKSRWRAHIYRGGKKHCLGHFLTAEEAARAYDQAALVLHGEFAITNFQREEYSNG